MLRILALALFLCCSLISLGQERLFPNKTWVNRKRLRDESYTMKWWVTVDSVRTEVASVKTQVKVLKRQGKVSVVQQVKMADTQSPWVDSTLVNLYDYSPVYHSSENPQRQMRLRFTRNNVNIFYQPAGQHATERDESVAGGFFDSNFYPYFFQWIDIYEGYSAQINVFDYSPEKKGLFKAWLKNAEEVDYKLDQGGQTRAWKLTVQDEISSYGTTYYFIAVKDHRLLEVVMEMGPTRMNIVRD